MKTMHTVITQTINKPINSEAQAIEFLNYLSSENLLYHPEDDATKIIHSLTGEYLFDTETAENLNQRMSEVYLHMTIDPCKHILDHLR